MKFKYMKGNLLLAPTEALVNTVNTVGVMGKGIALQFKERYPQNYQAYSKACKAHEVQVGKMFVFTENTIDGTKLIINFPTKKEWYRKSQYNYIESGLIDLVQVIKDYQIKSIALPPLGCGNGGLDWEKVRPMIVSYLGALQGVETLIYEPNAEVKKILQKEETTKKSKLTPARAMLLNLLFRHEQFGEEASVFVANKMAYLLQELGEDLKLTFIPHYYGPYSQAVEKVLYALNGTYLSGLEQMSASPFESLTLNYQRQDEVNEFLKKNLTRLQKERLYQISRLVSGFESALSLEVLSSVYYLMYQDKTKDLFQITQAINNWNKGKALRIYDEFIQIAYNHINKYNPQIQLDLV